MLIRNKYLTAPEFSSLLKSAETDKPAWMLFFTVGNLGLRVIEAHRMLASDIMVNDCLVRIRTAKQKEETVDELPVNPEIMRHLTEWIEQRGLTPEDYLFPWSKRMSQWMFTRYARAAGIHSPGRGIHSLRHFRGLYLTEAGANPVEVQTQLRHRSINSTNVYLHVSGTRELVNRIPMAI